MTRTRVRVLTGGVIVVLVGSLLLARWEPDYSRVPVRTLSDLARELELLRNRLDIPGLSAAVALDARIVWARGFGSADLESGAAVNPETTSFHLASVTKPYAATVVLQLVDEGRLQLDAPISDFGIEMRPREPVRVWHLLSHTSGGIPGTTYRYDARAFGLLTRIVERATARPFAAEFADRIVRRLGLDHTGPNPRDIDHAACRAQLVQVLLGVCGTPQHAGRVSETFIASGFDRQSLEAGLAIGYARAWGRQLWPAGLLGPMRPAQHLTELFASAGLVASATDVARFSIALDEGRLLKQTTLARAFEPAIGPASTTPMFGLGWFVQKTRGLSLAWQFGQAFESSALIVKIPAQRTTFVVLANSDGLSRRRRLGDHGNVLKSPAAMLFLTWYFSGRRL
jgi:CubicO group peptidase (beta-lactamase class C family)